MKTENVAESHQTDIPYTFPAGHETSGKRDNAHRIYFLSSVEVATLSLLAVQLMIRSVVASVQLSSNNACYMLLHTPYTQPRVRAV